MKLFDRYRDFPPGLRGIGLDAEFDYDRRTDTFSAFEKGPIQKNAKLERLTFSSGPSRNLSLKN